MKRLISIALTVAMALSLVTIAFATSDVSEKPLVSSGTTAADFSDVPTTYWAHDSIKQVVASGLFKGTTATTFSPQGQMTRAMFVVVLSRLDGVTVNNSAATGFDDVASSAWCAGAVAWAVSAGLVEGYGNNKFGPNDSITRQQIAVFLKRYTDTYKKYTLKEAALTNAFSDAAAASDYAKDAIEYCRIHGLVGGYADGTYQPKRNVTRAEVAAMLSRVVLILKEQTPTGGGGAGGGGGTTTNYYSIRMTGAKDETNYQYDLSAGISSNTIPGSSTIFSTVQKLYAGDNQTAIINYIDTILSKLKGFSYTGTFDGRDVTVSINSSGAISATASVGLDNLISVRDIANLVPETTSGVVSDTLTALSTGTGTLDSNALSAIISAANEIAGLGDSDLQSKIDAYSTGLSDSQKQILDSLNYDDIRAAATTYASAVQTVEETTLTNPVKMVVDMDLPEYVTRISIKYNGELSDALTKANEIGVNTEDTDTTDAIQALYGLYNPALFVNYQYGGNTISLLSAEEYFEKISPIVNAMETCRTTVAMKPGYDRATVFETYLNSAILQAQDDGTTFTGIDSSVVAALANVAAMTAPTMDNLYAALNGNLDVAASYEVTSAQALYETLFDIATRHGHDISDYSDYIQAALQAAIDRGAAGTYQSEFTITQK